MLWKILKRSGENKNKLRTIYPKNHENFKNSKPMVQFHWFLYKKKSVTKCFTGNGFLNHGQNILGVFDV